LRSVNGPQFTVIRGAQAPGGGNGNGAMRCVYLVNGVVISGFTVTNGTADDGGGLWCESQNVVVSNCVMAGNSANSYGGGASGGTLNDCMLTGNSANYGGGGADSATLKNCTLSGNSADGGGGGTAFNTLNNCVLNSNHSSQLGGGAYDSTLINCTVVGNSAAIGGGSIGSAMENCIVYYNIATNGANYFHPLGNVDYCCTTPLPADGIGNITLAPLLVDQAHGNLRLQPNSPCINAGNNAFAPVGPDLDGNSRVVSGTVDIGAYEFQRPGSVISYGWLQQYGLPTDGSADASDTDGDGLNNWQEWRCGTSPTNPLSVLRLLAPVADSTSVTVRWESVAGINYFLERSTSLIPPILFIPLATNVPGQPGTTSFADTSVGARDSILYRVGVH
ncbi:MAG: hypothetical protein NT154_39750, partial [Verrucomicrobia bacterium]|nr:hypothetical protein [Verrucomicrobiota bacterium]